MNKTVNEQVLDLLKQAAELAASNEFNSEDNNCFLFLYQNGDYTETVGFGSPEKYKQMVSDALTHDDNGGLKAFIIGYDLHLNDMKQEASELDSQLSKFFIDSVEFFQNGFLDKEKQEAIIILSRYGTVVKGASSHLKNVIINCLLQQPNVFELFAETIEIIPAIAVGQLTAGAGMPDVIGNAITDVDFPPTPQINEIEE